MTDRDTLTIDSAAYRIRIANNRDISQSQSIKAQEHGSPAEEKSNLTNKRSDQLEFGPIGGRVTDHWTSTLLYYGTKFKLKDSYPTTAN